MAATLKLLCLMSFVLVVTCESETDIDISQIDKVKRASDSKAELMASIAKKLQNVKEHFTEREFDLLDETLTTGEECPRVAKELQSQCKAKGKNKREIRKKRARSCRITCHEGSCSIKGWGCWCRCSLLLKAKCTCVR